MISRVCQSETIFFFPLWPQISFSLVDFIFISALVLLTGLITFFFGFVVSMIGLFLLSVSHFFKLTFTFDFLYQFSPFLALCPGPPAKHRPITHTTDRHVSPATSISIFCLLVACIHLIWFLNYHTQAHKSTLLLVLVQVGTFALVTTFFLSLLCLWLLAIDTFWLLVRLC